MQRTSAIISDYSSGLSPITVYSSRNIGGTDAWAIPQIKFWDDRPSVPLSLRPCNCNNYNSGDWFTALRSSKEATGLADDCWGSFVSLLCDCSLLAQYMVLSL